MMLRFNFSVYKSSCPLDLDGVYQPQQISLSEVAETKEQSVEDLIDNTANIFNANIEADGILPQNTMPYYSSDKQDNNKEENKTTPEETEKQRTTEEKESAFTVGDKVAVSVDKGNIDSYGEYDEYDGKEYEVKGVRGNQVVLDIDGKLKPININKQGVTLTKVENNTEETGKAEEEKVEEPKAEDNEVETKEEKKEEKSKVENKSLAEKIKTGEVLSQNAEETLVDLYSNMSKEDAQEVVNGIIKQTQDRQKQLAKKTINYEDIDKFQQHKKQVRETEKKLAYWNEVKSLFTAPLSQEEEVQSLKSIKEKEGALGQAYSMREYILRNLALGAKFLWNDSENGTKGLGSHLGLREAKEERRNYYAFLNGKDRKAVYPEVYAERLLIDVRENINPNVSFDEVFNEMIDCLSSYSTPTAMMDEAVRMHYEAEDNLTQNDFEKQQQAMIDRAEKREEDRIQDELNKQEALSEEDYERMRQGFDEQERSNKESKEDAERNDEEIKPIGTNKWGNVYQGKKGKAKEYAHFLEREKSGYVKDAFSNKELGNIDLNWGNEKGGLKHIIDKHIKQRNDFASLDEAIDTIEDVLANGEMTEQGTNRSFDYNGYRISVAQSNEGKWVITAFEKTRSKENKERKSDTTIGDQSTDRKENGTLVSPDLLSNGKDTTVSENEQEKEEKNDKDTLKEDRSAKNITESESKREGMLGVVLDALRKAIGKDNVITDSEEAQRIIDEQNGIVRPERVAEVNKRFNEELDEFKDKQLKGGILHLGEPNALLRSSGLNASEITLTAKTLKEHLDKHGISIEEIKDLPNAINNPMMVYEWGTKAKSTIIITNITRENSDKITVAVKLERNGEEMTINEIASIHGKEGQRFISDMINAKEGGIEKALKYIQKDRKEVLDWLGLDAPKASASLTNEELHIAKVLQNFENPTIIEQKNEKNLKEHRLVGGNRGYVGYSMSKRAEQAREEGRYPKTDFKKVYNISDKTLKALVSAGIIDDNEWHHTSKYGNKTTFYGWSEEKFATIYRLFKKEIDAIVKENQPQPNPYKYTEWNEFSEEFQALPYNVKKDKGSKELQDFLKTHPEDKAKYEENERYNQWQAQAPSPIETTRIVSEKLNKFFDEKDVKFFKTKDGEAYGFTVGGKVYIDTKIADASTPIHEYTHLWAEALRKVNPKEWQNIVGLMKKQTHLWDKVKNDYPELKSDDEIADEVLAHYSGERGKKLLDEEYNKIRGNNKLNIFDKAKMLQAINNVREALRKFWKGVADLFNIHFTSAEEVADKVLSDLLEGVNPNEVKNRDEAYMEAVEKGDMEAEQKMVDEEAKQAGYTIHAYHGTGRADRVGNVFRPERATSGPMAFFTDNKPIAESYARGKQDTSIAYDTDYDDYKTQFRTKHKATGKDYSIYDVWGFMPFSERNKIAENAKHVRSDWEGDGKPIYDPNTTEANGGWEWQVKENRGNILRALTDQWLESGNLFNREEEYLDVLKLTGVTETLEKLGFEMPRYMDPNYREEAVYDVYLKIEKPFDATTMVNDEFIEGFEEFAAKHEDEYTNERADADMWDKNNVDADEFVERMRNDIENGKTYAWTSIPDVMTAYLKSLGYDGIKDSGGKNGGEQHTVWVPFSGEQVKRTDPVTYDDNGNVIPLSERFNSEKADIRFHKSTERVVEKATNEALEEVKDPILKRAYKGILKESTKDKWASFADDYHALRVMEDKVIEEMRKRDPKFRLHHSVYEQQIAAKAATQGQIFLFSQQTFKPLLDKVDKIANKYNLSQKEVEQFMMFQFYRERTDDVIYNRWRETQDRIDAGRTPNKEYKEEYDAVKKYMGSLTDRERAEAERKANEIFGKIAEEKTFGSLEEMDEELDQLKTEMYARAAANKYRQQELWDTKNKDGIRGFAGEESMCRTALYQTIAENYFPKEKGNMTTTRLTPDEIIEKFRDMVGKDNVDELNKLSRAVTQFTLDKALETGNITREEYEKYQRQEYYVPLRGWDKDDGEVSVFGNDTSFQSVNPNAKGRTTTADNPLKYMFVIASNQIHDFNEKQAKRSLINFINEYKDIIIGANATKNKGTGTLIQDIDMR